jgi:hypothetical protein
MLIVGAAAGVAAAGAFAGVIGEARAASAGGAAPQRLFVYQVQFPPPLVVRGELVEVGYNAQTSADATGVPRGTGTLYVRNDLQRQRFGHLARGPRSDVAAGDLDRQSADLDRRGLALRRLAGQHLTDRLVADRLLKCEDGVVHAPTGASRRVVGTMVRCKLTIAGHVRPTVP